VAAKFVLEKDAAGRFRFRLMSQGRVLANSESYTTKRAAQNAIASIRTTAPGAQIDDGTQAAATTKVRAVRSRTVAKKLESAVEGPIRKARSTAKSLVAATTGSDKTSAATTGTEAPAKRAPAKRAPAKRAPAKRAAKAAKK
jgi:DNA-binding protein HU-beta